MLIHPTQRRPAEETELSELLVDFPCFHSVAEDNFDRLIELSREIYMECLLPDTVVLEQDDEPESCFVIMQGQCKVDVTFKYKKFAKTKTKTKQMCVLGNRAMFGELSLLFNGPRTATVKTMEASYVIVIP
jgi:CRP-like cAMP-binding protein